MRLSLCTFTCHLHWSAPKDKRGLTFHDAVGFFDHARSLGLEGVQASVHSMDEAKEVRARIEQTGGCFEGDVAFPHQEGDLAHFEQQLAWSAAAGATVARTYALGARRYETFHSLADYQMFAANTEHMLGRMEPLLRKHRIRLALENHKDRMVDDLIALLQRLSSEWIGVNVDTGNNIALLEEPHAVIDALAPFAASVHLKDMAVQAQADGFLLSEVVLGTGFLDLSRMIATLRKANPGIVFNLEMATRDPLRILCLKPDYWTTFPDRRATELAHALSMVHAHPSAQPLPTIQGKSLDQQLAFEDDNNRACVAWMLGNIKP